MPGQRYTQEELAAMSQEEFAAAAECGFEKASAPVPPVPPVPAPEPRDDVWASRARSGSDFTCPSGQRCRLRKVQPEQLMKAGILDRVTRLEGLANELVEQAEGQPPQAKKMPSTEDFEMLLETINIVVPLAVEQPVIYAEHDKEAPDGAIRVTDIDLMDRMAILERSLNGLRLLDAFRYPR